jgi:ligand-binding sensor domain-containing protein
VEGSGVMRFDGSDWLSLSIADGLPSDWVNAIDVAADGTLWFATRDAGIARLSPP